MKQPAISIIVPVYNAEKYLRRCIDSILSQSLTDFELILIDDGSTDRSPLICDEYATRDKRIRLIHKKNDGVSAARNDGIDIAQGEFITFVDSDDWVDEVYLNTLLQYKQYDIVFFSHRLIFDDGYTSEFIFEEKEGDIQTIWDIVSLLKNNSTKWNFYGYTWNKMFRRDLVERYKVRFVDGLRISEDEVYTLDYCTHAKSIRVLPLCLYNYRVLGTGLTATKNSSAEYELLADSFIDILNRSKKHEIEKTFWSDIVEYLYAAAMANNNFFNVYRIIKKTKKVTSQFSQIKECSKKQQLIIAFPAFLMHLWWCCYRMKMYLVKMVKR